MGEYLLVELSSSGEANEAEQARGNAHDGQLFFELKWTVPSGFPSLKSP